MNKLPILITGNPETSFAKQDYQYYLSQNLIELHFVDVNKIEIDAFENPQQDIPKVLEKISELVQLQAPCVLIHGVGSATIIKAANERFPIPIYNASILLFSTAHAIAKRHFTIIPVMSQFQDYLNEEVKNAGASTKYIPCDSAVEMPLWQFRNNEQAYQKTKTIVFQQIERGIDTITFGCSGFADMVDRLRTDISQHTSQPIQLLDHISLPVDILLNVFKTP